MSVSRLVPLVLLALLALPGSARAEPVVAAVTYFDNTAKDKSADMLRKGLADMLITDLSVSKDLRLVERANLEDLLQEIDLQKSAFLDPATAVKIGAGLGAAYIITGSYLVHGGAMRIDARVVDVASSEIVLAVKAEGQRENFSASATELARKILNGLGAALSLLEKKKLGVGSTPSYKAFSAYSQGLDHLDSGDQERATQALARAVEADPDFGLAKTRLEALREAVNRAVTARSMQHERLSEETLALVRKHRKGDVQACLKMVTGFANEGALLSEAAFGFLLYHPDSPDWQHIARKGGPAGKEELEKRLYRLYALALKMRELNLKPLQMTISGQTLPCHPELFALGSILTAMAHGTGQLAPVPSKKPIPILRDPDGAVVIDRGNYLDLYASLGERFLELDPSGFPIQFQVLDPIQWAVDFLQEEERLQSLPAAEQKKRRAGKQAKQASQLTRSWLHGMGARTFAGCSDMKTNLESEFNLQAFNQDTRRLNLPPVINSITVNREIWSGVESIDVRWEATADQGNRGNAVGVRPASAGGKVMTQSDWISQALTSPISSNPNGSEETISGTWTPWPTKSRCAPGASGTQWECPLVAPANIPFRSGLQKDGKTWLRGGGEFLGDQGLVDVFFLYSGADRVQIKFNLLDGSEYLSIVSPCFVEAADGSSIPTDMAYRKRSDQLNAEVLAAYRRSDFDAARALLEELLELEPQLVYASYNLACLYALNGEQDKALHMLEQAIELGFTELGFARDDPDLDSLHEHERFRKLVGLDVQDAPAYRSDKRR